MCLQKNNKPGKKKKKGGKKLEVADRCSWQHQESPLG